MRDYLLKATIFGIAIMMFFGCAKKEKISQEDTLVIGLQQTISTLDPAMHRDRTVESVIRNMFDGLVTRDSNMIVVP